MCATEIPITRLSRSLLSSPGRDIRWACEPTRAGPYRARLLRVISADPNPHRPGMRFEDLSHLLDQSLGGRRQEVRLGSYGTIETRRARDPRAACTWTLLVRPGVIDPSAALLPR